MHWLQHGVNPAPLPPIGEQLLADRTVAGQRLPAGALLDVFGVLGTGAPGYVDHRVQVVNESPGGPGLRRHHVHVLAKADLMLT